MPLHNVKKLYSHRFNVDDEAIEKKNCNKKDMQQLYQKKKKKNQKNLANFTLKCRLKLNSLLCHA